MHQLESNLTQVRHRIQAASRICQQTSNAVTLLAVSKKQPLQALEQAYQLGQRDFGENYLQESLDKIASANMPDANWHFIGPIQSNKTRSIASHFDWVHAVDRLKIAQRLNDQRPQSLSPLNICLQVNIDNETNKSGVLPENLLSLAENVMRLPHLRLRGLMAIPAKTQKSDKNHAFARMHTLFQQIQSKFQPNHWDTLSMGMSADMEEAIQHGATIVRVGTAIFGERQ